MYCFVDILNTLSIIWGGRDDGTEAESGKRGEREEAAFRLLANSIYNTSRIQT